MFIESLRSIAAAMTGGMSKTAATHYHAQLRLSDNDRAIKVLISAMLRIKSLWTSKNGQALGC